MPDPREIIAVLTLAVGLFVVAAFGAREEVASFAMRTASLPSRVAAAVAAGRASEPSSWLASDSARSAQLDMCLTTLKETIRASPSVASIVDDLDRGCLRVAESATAHAPASANVWFLAATEAARLGDNVRLREYLKASYRTGPAEGWIAERRGLYGYGIADRLDPDLRTAVDGDLALLLRTTTGVKLLAERYVADPDLREHLAGIAGRLDPRTQHDFFEYVKGAYYDRRDQ